LSGVRPKRKKTSDRWWRISDEKIKESKTSEVLGMQREVYLLFYELEKAYGDEV
jgi:ubiquitin carboxyl-terminal hydrolase 16